jgi:hypothetical protein
MLLGGHVCLGCLSNRSLDEERANEEPSVHNRCPLARSSGIKNTHRLQVSVIGRCWVWSLGCLCLSLWKAAPPTPRSYRLLCSSRPTLAAGGRGQENFENVYVAARRDVARHGIGRVRHVDSYSLSRERESSCILSQRHIRFASLPPGTFCQNYCRRYVQYKFCT